VAFNAEIVEAVWQCQSGSFPPCPSSLVAECHNSHAAKWHILKKHGGGLRGSMSLPVKPRSHTILMATSCKFACQNALLLAVETDSTVKFNLPYARKNRIKQHSFTRTGKVGVIWPPSTVSALMQLPFSLSYAAIFVCFAFDVTYADVAYTAVKLDRCFIGLANNSVPFSSFLCLLFCPCVSTFECTLNIFAYHAWNQLWIELSKLTASFKTSVRPFLFCNQEHLLIYSECTFILIV